MLLLNRGLGGRSVRQHRDPQVPDSLNALCWNETHRMQAQLRGEYLLDEHRGGKRPPRHLDAVDQAILIQVQVLVSFHRDPIAAEGEEHGCLAREGTGLEANKATQSWLAPEQASVTTSPPFPYIVCLE
jgi:hypothetical protein